MSTCNDCKHWDNSEAAPRTEFGSTGLCRRAAPLVGNRNGLAVWPFSYADDRCGEHSPIVRWPNDLTQPPYLHDELPF